MPRHAIIFLSALAVFSTAAAQSEDSGSSATSMALVYLRDGLIIDGRLGDWRGVAPLRLDSGRLVRGAAWGGTDDLSARVWLAWDDDSFYFAADLRDDDFLGCPRGNQVWEADAFLLSFRFPEIVPDDPVFFIVVTEKDGEPKGVGLSGRGGGYAQHPLPSLRLAFRPREGMAPVMEGTVRWSDFLGPGVPPPERLELNFEFRDLDLQGRIKSISWAPGAGGETGGGAPTLGLAVLMKPDELDGLIRRRSSADFAEIVQLVVLPVVVTDGGNNYVLGLDAEDFLITEDGVEQQVSSMRFETRPMTIGLLIDSSGSMEHHVDGAKRAAINFLEALREEDRCFVISFNHNIDLIKDLAGDTAEAVEAIRGISAEGGTFLYSAVNFALNKLRFLREKKVLVLLTDGKDESFGAGPYSVPVGFGHVREKAIRQETVVYAMAYRMRDTSALSEIGSLTRDTGGRIFTPSTAVGLLSAYREIARDLKSQYLLTYVSNDRNWDGRWRKIDVRVRGKDYRVRTRPGYYAPRR